MGSELDDRLDRRFSGKELEAFQAMGLVTVGDLLRRAPRRYVELSVLTDLDSVPVGDPVTVVAEVVRVSGRYMKSRRGRLTEVVVTDGRKQMSLTFFNQQWRERIVKAGHRVVLSGKLGTYRGALQLTHPAIENLDDEPPPRRSLVDRTDDPPEPDDALAEELRAERDGSDLRPFPIYALARGLGQGAARRAVWNVLRNLQDAPDPIPHEIRRRHRLLSLRETFVAVHRPTTEQDWRRGLFRLRWEEAFILQLELARRRALARAEPALARRPVTGGLLSDFDARLPFGLTDGQRQVSSEIEADLAAEQPMHRLLQGEVGTGKTVVALRAMLAVVDAGGQSALLAPTEVLAQQHLRSVTAMLGPLAEAGQLTAPERATRVVLLTGSMGAQARRAALLEIASGDAGVVVGTHALLEEQVSFFDLGLVVIDEQHRFGVGQRDRLRAKAGRPPHVLVMTATPIPRTIAMTVFGDLDVSTLSEQPAGRAGVETHVVPELDKPRFLERAWQRVREEVTAGRQAFVVCPQISSADAGSEELDEELVEDDPSAAPAGQPPVRAVLDLLPSLTASSDAPLAGLRVEALHGRQPPETKDDVMRRFAAGDIDVLVATTVIEVGVDVPNASAMVVMDAQRFGISQLHQLRGRVARGSARGLCLLVTSAPAGTPGRRRVEVVAATSDGFALAEADLEERREGDVLGRLQSGLRSSLRHLRVLTDRSILEAARAEAIDLIARDFALESAPRLAAELAALAERQRIEYLERS